MDKMCLYFFSDELTKEALSSSSKLLAKEFKARGGKGLSELRAFLSSKGYSGRDLMREEKTLGRHLSGKKMSKQIAEGTLQREKAIPMSKALRKHFGSHEGDRRLSSLSAQVNRQTASGKSQSMFGVVSDLNPQHRQVMRMVDRGVPINEATQRVGELQQIISARRVANRANEAFKGI